MRHTYRPVLLKKFQRLPVRQVSLVSTNAAFKVAGIAAISEHGVVVVGFQKGSMALAEMANNIAACFAYICKNANPCFVALHGETAGLHCIVKLRESSYAEVADMHGVMKLEGNCLRILGGNPAF